MSTAWQDQLDDPVLEAESIGFDGVNSRMRPALIQDTELSQGNDSIIGDTGMAMTRFPAKTVGDALSVKISVSTLTSSGTTATCTTAVVHGYSTGDTVIIAAADQSDYNGSFTITVSSTTEFTYTMLADPSVDTATGTITAYKKITTSVDGIGFFDTPTTEELLCCFNKALYSLNHLRVPIWTDLSAAVVGKTRFAQLIDKMYFVDGDSLRAYDGSTVTTISTFDGVSSTIPKASSLISHGNALVLSAVNDPAYERDAIYRSDLLDGNTWLLTNSIRVGAGDGDPIVTSISWHDSFIAVLKENSIWAVNMLTTPDTTASSWTLEIISRTNSQGCIAADTVRNVGNDVWYLSREGLTSIIREKASEQRQMGVIILNTPVNDIFEDINWDEAGNSCAEVFNNRYYLSLPTGTSAVPNTTLVYNLLTRKWEGPFTGTLRKPLFYGISNFNSRKTMVWQNNNYELAWQDERVVREPYDFLDLNPITSVEDIDLDVYTKAWDFRYPQNWKQGFVVEVQFYRSAGTADIYLIPDEDEDNIYTVATGVETSDNPTLPQTLPFTLNGKLDKCVVFHVRDVNRFKELRVRIKGNGSQIKVRSVKVNAFLDTMEFHNQ